MGGIVDKVNKQVVYCIIQLSDCYLLRSHLCAPVCMLSSSVLIGCRRHQGQRWTPTGKFGGRQLVKKP